VATGDVYLEGRNGNVRELHSRNNGKVEKETNVAWLRSTLLDFK
jgi:hypothetical protein